MRSRAALSGVVLAAALAGLAPAPGRAAGPFEGDFVGEEGERLSLRQHGDRVTGSLVQGDERAEVAGQVQGGVLRGTLRLFGQETRFTLRPVRAGLQVTLEDDDEPALFARRGGVEAPPGQASAAASEPPGRPAPARGKPGSPAAAEPPVPAAGEGRVYRVPHEGWSVRLPPGWDGQERDGALALGSRTEAGLLVVRPSAARDPEALRAGLAEDLAEAGLAGQVPALEPARWPAGRGFSVELPVTAQDGAALRLRAVAVVGERGTVAVLGTTTAEKMGTLRRRVDELAASVRFFAPEVSAAQRSLAGEWWGYSSAGPGATGGTESTLALCPDGRFFSSSESSYGGGAGTSGAWGIAGQRSAGGGSRWTASGTAASGRIIVTRPDGSTWQLSYRTEPGGGAYFDGRLHGKTGERRYCR